VLLPIFWAPHKQKKEKIQNTKKKFKEMLEEN
jgi:hypothetical protein